MEEKYLVKALAGLHTKVDPTRVAYNPDTGVSELAEGYNITLDNTGRGQRRFGNSQLVAGEFHSGWCDQGDAFCIQETASWGSIMRFSPDLLSLSGVVSGLTKNRRMSFVDFLSTTYYSNGMEKGKIVDGVSSSWVAGTHPDSESTFQGLELPAGTHLARHKNRLAIAVDNTVWFTEPNRPDLIDAVRGSWSFPTRVRMVAPVETGVFVSDQMNTYFLQGNAPFDFAQRKAAKYPAHEYSLCIEELDVDDLNMQEAGGGRVWSSSEGICVGLPSGRFVNLTREKVSFPQGYNKGASLLCGYHVISTMF